MRKIPFLLLLLGLLGCGEVVRDAFAHAQRCIPSTGKPLPIQAQYPEDGATNVDPQTVVVVQVDTAQTMALSSMRITPTDSAEPRWHYTTGMGADGRFITYPEHFNNGSPPSPDYHDAMSAVTVAEAASLRAPGSFSPNATITIEVEANCYDVHRFSFTTAEAGN